MPSNKNVNCIFLITIILYIGISLLLGILPIELPMNLSLILSEVLILLPVLIYCGIKKISIPQLIPFRKMKPSVWILVVICTYLMYPLMIVLNAISLFFVDSATADLMGMITDGNFFIATLLMALLPAFAEEFLFRGVLFQTYRRSRMLLAIILSGFLFGGMHMNLNQFLYAFALGIYMAFLVEATGSILSSMLAHFVINFTSVVMSYALVALEQTDLGSQMALNEQMAAQGGNFFSTMDGASLVIMIIGVAFWGVIALGTTAGGIGVYIAISKISGRWEHVKSMFFGGTRERTITGSLVITIALMIVMMVRSALR